VIAIGIGIELLIGHEWEIAPGRLAGDDPSVEIAGQVK